MAISEADLPEIFFRRWFQESWKLERSTNPHQSVALSSVLLRRIFFAAHKHLILGYFYLLFIVRHGTKSCPGTEKQRHWQGAIKTCVDNKPLGGDRRLGMLFLRK